MDALFNFSFQDWLAQQGNDLEDLERALVPPAPEPELRAAVARTISHFEGYSAQRLSLARLDPPAFFCPKWCSSFENSILWLGGCRPSLFIRLVSSNSPAACQITLEEFLNAAARQEEEEEISRLRAEVVREEQVIDAKMANMQEALANRPLLAMAERSEPAGAGNGNASEAIGAYADELMGILEEADWLRVRTLRRLATDILKPRRAAEFLKAGKKLHLSVHDWGLTRDRERGRNS